MPLQDEVVNNEGIIEIIKLMIGTAADKIGSISLIKTACSVATNSGYASYTQCSEAGCTLATIATLTGSASAITNDTAHARHVFTAGAAATVKGHMVVDANVTPSHLFSVCCYAGDITLESGDTVTVNHKITAVDAS